PNPASETVRIELTADNDFVCKLISPQGAVVYSEMFDASTSNINLNVSNLPKGVYVLQLINNEGILTKKLIIE
ncbi:MAG: T9SS type A sorting domain-containing protein, partial [Bacteroidales bacterium]|nr:T9SS type A sorting domain-containing protein [Bacteroidales bacterium]